MYLYQLAATIIMIYNKQLYSPTSPNSVAYNNKLFLILTGLRADLGWAKMHCSGSGCGLAGLASRLVSAQVLGYFTCLSSSSGHALLQVKEGIQGQAQNP